MDWIEAAIETTTAGAEAITGLVLQLGIGGMIIDDPRDLERYLASPQAARWDYVDEGLLVRQDRPVQVRLYVADNAQGRRQWQDLRQGLALLKAEDGQGYFGALDWSLAGVREEDWANNWKAYFKPFPIGKRLVIKPTWEAWPAEDQRTILEIDPGSSFGTGQHQTTRLCLELLEGYVMPGGQILDLGCGSGILSIAALLLGAGRARAVDIDEAAAACAAVNARQNRLSASAYATYTGDIVADNDFRQELAAQGPADLVLANIVADVILAMTPFFAGFLRPGGVLLVSGIIDDRLLEVEQALALAGFALLEGRQDGDWHALAWRYHSAHGKRLGEG